MDTQVSPAVVVVVLILVAAILVAMYFVVFQPDDQEQLGEEAILVAPPEADKAMGAPPGEAVLEQTAPPAADSKPLPPTDPNRKTKPESKPVDVKDIEPNPLPKVPTS